MFGHDSFLWYNVGQWSELGLAVPNFGNDTTSQNSTIRYLTAAVGRNLQAIMAHTDAKLTTPPSINTLTRMHKLCVRTRQILSSRAVPSGTLALEPIHAVPAPEEFLVYPAPYFRVRNQWLKEWAGYALLAMTEAFQHQENAKAVEISEEFGRTIGQYFQRIYRLLAVELFRIDRAAAEAPDFTLSDEQLASYNPGAWFTSTEMIDVVPRFDAWPTEDDLEVLTNGIPISHLPVLGRWPSGGVAGSAKPAASSEAFLGQPAV